MSLCLSTAEVRSRYVYCSIKFISIPDDPGPNRRRTYIDILDDDPLLYIFYHCRPVVFEEHYDDYHYYVPEGGDWERERWWHSLAQVCRRWRRLILASPSYLGISFLCKLGAQVADMLAHSPPLPLTVDYHCGHIARDEELEGILLALKYSDRVRRIHFSLSGPGPSLERLIAAIDKEFRMLEYLYIYVSVAPRLNWSQALPSTLCAPQLRHLELFYFTFPIGCPLPAGLVTLTLGWIHPSADLDPNELLQQLSLLTRLETLRISFDSPPSDEDVERQLLQTPLSTHATLPSLRSFMFEGPLSYIMSVLPWVTMPFLNVAEIKPPTSHDLDFPVSLVLQFVYKTENPGFRDVRVIFYPMFVLVTMYPHAGTGMPALRMRIWGRVFVVGLESTVRRFREMGAVFSEVESLTLEDKIPWGLSKHSLTDWHELLGLFAKVRTLHVAGSATGCTGTGCSGDLIEKLSHVLQPHDGESAIELLPTLSVFSCPEGSHIGESCRSFLTSRRDAGFPVTIAHH